MHDGNLGYQVGRCPSDGDSYFLEGDRGLVHNGPVEFRKRLSEDDITLGKAFTEFYRPIVCRGVIFTGWVPSSGLTNKHCC